MRIQILMQRLGIVEVSGEGIEAVEGAGGGVVVSGAWVAAGTPRRDRAYMTLRFPDLPACACGERTEGVRLETLERRGPPARARVRRAFQLIKELPSL
jgi:hypothetical protein